MSLLKGEPFLCSNKIIAKHPTINEILNFGEKNYDSVVDIFCSKPYDYMVQLDDMGIDWTTKTNYDLFVMLFQSDIEGYNVLFSWLFCCEKCLFDVYVHKDNGDLVLFDSVSGLTIDRLIYEEISYYLKRVNFIAEDREYNPGDFFARQMVLDQERKRIKRLLRNPKPPESRLAILISFLMWNNTNGMKYEDIFNLSIYQFHDGVKRLSKTEKYREKMLGYYTGNIEGKNLDMEKIYWVNKTTVDD